MHESAICILGYLCSLKQQIGQLCQNFSLVQKNVCDLIWSFKSWVHWRLKYNEVLNRCFHKKPISVSNNSKIPNNFVFLHWVPKRWNKDHNQTSVKKTVMALRESARGEGGVISEAVWQGASGRCRAYSFKGTTTNYLYFKGTQHTLTSSTSPSRGHTPTIFTTPSRGHTVHTH